MRLIHTYIYIYMKVNSPSHEVALPKHSVTALFIPTTFCCELPGKVKTEYQDEFYYQKLGALEGFTCRKRPSFLLRLVVTYSLSMK